MAVSGQRVIRFTADNDLYDSGQRRLQIVGCRLVTVAADATAQIRVGDANGEIVMSLAAAAKYADESTIPFFIEGGKIFVDLSGSAAEVFVYVE